MKTPFTQRYLSSAFGFLILSVLMALMAACVAPPEANTNATANANSANSAAPGASSGYIDLVGEWKGQLGGHPSTLIITNHKGETFSGTETVGDNQIAIAGTVDLQTREINLREVNLVKGEKNYPLGAGTGTIAPNSRQMTGEWKAKGSASSFSFSK